MTKEKVKSKIENKEQQSENKFLILHNDDINTFDFVIESLVEVCKHTEEQAEQCAIITHYKGKCDVKKGDYSSLKPLKDELSQRGLSVTID
jgi:ATP-dependent Clp protease adaptor protein ClpS